MELILFGTAEDVRAAMPLMTEEQKRLVRAQVDTAEGAVYTLGEFAGDGGDIRDPVGQDEARYRSTRDEIKRRLEASLERLLRLLA